MSERQCCDCCSLNCFRESDRILTYHPPSPGFALLGCEVVFTDQASIIPLLHRNVERNLSSASMAAQQDTFLGAILSHVMCSDFPEFLDPLQLVPENIPFLSPADIILAVVSTGKVGNTRVVELEWGDEQQIDATGPPFDFIIGTDVVSSRAESYSSS